LRRLVRLDCVLLDQPQRRHDVRESLVDLLERADVVVPVRLKQLDRPGQPPTALLGDRARR